jgi:hypothetical protein
VLFGVLADRIGRARALVYCDPDLFRLHGR